MKLPRESWTPNLRLRVRQGERNLSGFRPYKTDSFHPPSSFNVFYCDQFQFIQEKFSSCFFPMVFTLCLAAVCICHSHVCSCQTDTFGANLIMKLFCRLRGTYCCLVVRDAHTHFFLVKYHVQFDCKIRTCTRKNPQIYDPKKFVGVD